MSTTSMWEGEAYKEAADKSKTVGPLGITAEDHEAIGGTPPEELKDNPGKTFVELMSDKELLEYLVEQKDKLAELEGMLSGEHRSEFIQSFAETTRRNLKLSVEYLRKIGRLPEEFSSFELKEGG